MKIDKYIKLVLAAATAGATITFELKVDDFGEIDAAGSQKITFIVDVPYKPTIVEVQK